MSGMPCIRVCPAVNSHRAVCPCTCAHKWTRMRSRGCADICTVADAVQSVCELARCWPGPPMPRLAGAGARAPPAQSAHLARPHDRLAASGSCFLLQFPTASLTSPFFNVLAQAAAATDAFAAAAALHSAWRGGRLGPPGRDDELVAQFLSVFTLLCASGGGRAGAREGGWRWHALGFARARGQAV